MSSCVLIFLASQYVLKLMRFPAGYSKSLFLKTRVSAEFLPRFLVISLECAQQDVSIRPIIFPRRRFFACL
jgi:hypothetical protein